MLDFIFAITLSNLGQDIRYLTTKQLEDCASSCASTVLARCVVET